MSERPAPRISVCFTNYNYERYCGDAVHSILAQDYDDFEVVIVENASTDRGPEIMRALEQDPRVVAIYLTENVGCAGGWQVGLQHARGAYICFLSTDDLWQPDFLSELAALLDAEPRYPLAYGRVEVFGEDTAACAAMAAMFNPGQHDALGFFDTLLQRNFIPQAATLLRRDIVEAVGGFNPAIRITMDYDLLFRVALRGPGGFVDRMLARYRWHGGNVSRPGDATAMGSLRDKITSLETLLRQYGAELDRIARREVVREHWLRGLGMLGRKCYRTGRYREARACFRRLRREDRLERDDLIRYFKSYAWGWLKGRAEA